MASESRSNEEVADVLDQISDLLETQGANPFRVRAYRRAAHTVRTAERSIVELARHSGEEGLKELPNIGEGIAGVIDSYVQTGRSDMLAQLQAEVEPESLFEQVPGIGPELAGRVVEELEVSTLEELEQAAHDSRLGEVEGFGSERVRNVRLGLAGMLSTAAIRRRRSGAAQSERGPQPGVDVLLDVDREYRRKAEAGELRRIAPKRFNPEGEAWLPILNTERDGWSFTALYSNTKRAHELDKTDDWVVLYYSADDEEDQATVVTETKGPMRGRRVVRGREAECREYYQSAGKAE